MEKTWLKRFREGDRDAFTVIFTTCYRDMVLFAMNFTRETEIAEEIVQDTFVKLWDDRKFLTIDISLKSYLLRCVQNRCIDWIRHEKIRQKYLEDASATLASYEYNTDNYVINSELEDLLKIALAKLPPEIYEAYCMSRYKGLKYKDIAIRLKVSVRTVEVRIGKALSSLREDLKDYLE
ncbi:MAG TPA: RNA polymerase sigma-70 factor [Bacteroidales bacterium]|nr:RNA polymerase sigma-70 factor [Bacteroidales bacterium]